MEYTSIKITKNIRTELDSLKDEYNVSSYNSVIGRLLSIINENKDSKNYENLLLESLNIYFNTLDSNSLNNLNSDENEIIGKAKKIIESKNNT